MLQLERTADLLSSGQREIKCQRTGRIFIPIAGAPILRDLTPYERCQGWPRAGGVLNTVERRWTQADM